MRRKDAEPVDDREVVEAALCSLARDDLLMTLKTYSLHRDFYEPGGGEHILGGVAAARKLPIASFLSGAEYRERRRSGDFASCNDVSDAMRLVLIHAGVPRFRTLEWEPSVEEAPRWQIDRCNEGHDAVVAKLADLDGELEAFLAEPASFGVLLLKSSAPSGLLYDGPPLRAAIHAPLTPSTHHWTLVRAGGLFRVVQSFGGLFTLEEALDGGGWLSAEEARGTWRLWRRMCTDPSAEGAAEAATELFGFPFVRKSGRGVRDMAVLAVRSLRLGSFLGSLETLLRHMAQAAQGPARPESAADPRRERPQPRRRGSRSRTPRGLSAAAAG